MLSGNKAHHGQPRGSRVGALMCDRLDKEQSKRDGEEDNLYAGNGADS